MRVPTATNVRHYLEWLALRGVVSSVRSCPIERAYRRTRRLAALGRRVLRHEWRWCLRNLQLVFGPALDRQALRRLAARVFEEHFYSYLEGIRWRDVEVRVEGAKYLDRAKAPGQGVIGCSIHLGSFEPAGEAFLAGDPPGTDVYRLFENPLSQQVLEAVRGERQGRYIPEHDLHAVARCLKEGRKLGLMIDLDAPRGGVAASFLGIPAMTPAGPARLALHFRVPIVPTVTLRAGEGRAILRFVGMLDPEESRSAADPVVHLTERIHRCLEPSIIQYAEQYNWLHPRWLTRPDGSVWTLDDPIESQWAARTAPFAQLPARLHGICYGHSGEG
ncbi:MAG: lysophospholipid acyltransferase family protein [Candidatus Sumerlaeota bacterium]|nr:lysophospholipid acyltransferase family protein [Candidatus Sumerlaeota bacterium]